MSKKAKICLNAMVGNESKTILRMLESAEPYIDYWVIQCNGNDNTEKIIQDFFNSKNKPGFTYQIEWNFPGWNRDHTLQTCLKADHGCDWILRMDADERLYVDPDFDWSVLEDTSIDSFNIVAQNGELRYLRTWFWNAKRPWFFQHDKRHETIHLPEIGEGFVRITMPSGFRHLVSQDGETWAAPRKFLKDALELEMDKVVGNTVLEDPYHLWYIAKSYSDCYGDFSQLPFGKKHADEYARRSVWYYDRWFEHNFQWDITKSVTRLDEMAYFALIMMAHAYEFMGEIEKSLQYINKAGEFAPNRNEHLIYANFILEKLERFDEILQNIEFMVQPDRTNPFPNSSFLIEDRAYANTSNYLFEYREKIKKRMENPIIDNSSFKFEF
jgi:tetratricopeptide (TPR) repeat protein